MLSTAAKVLVNAGAFTAFVAIGAMVFESLLIGVVAGLIVSGGMAATRR